MRPEASADFCVCPSFSGLSARPGKSYRTHLGTLLKHDRILQRFLRVWPEFHARAQLSRRNAEISTPAFAFLSCSRGTEAEPMLCAHPVMSHSHAVVILRSFCIFAQSPTRDWPSLLKDTKRFNRNVDCGVCGSQSLRTNDLVP